MRESRKAPLRQLSPQQVDMLSATLRNVSGQLVGIEFVAGDPEATQFAAQLISVFQTSGWTVQELSEIHDPHVSGLSFVIESHDNPPTFLAMLQRIFASLDIAAVTVTDKNCKPREMKLRVGHKPDG